MKGPSVRWWLCASHDKEDDSNEIYDDIPAPSLQLHLVEDNQHYGCHHQQDNLHGAEVQMEGVYNLFLLVGQQTWLGAFGVEIVILCPCCYSPQQKVAECEKAQVCVFDSRAVKKYEGADSQPPSYQLC